MRAVANVSFDLLREAIARKWFLALGVGITLVLVTLAVTLEMEVVDGALAATRLFGRAVGRDIRPADVALQPVFKAAAYLVFYGGLVFGILSCADFAPSLLAPGRIEHLLSLPVRRWELLAGTFLGVLILATLGAIYGAGGLTVILGAKTGVWTVRPVAAGVLGALAFASVYGAMLASAVFVRSAALSAAVGGGVFVAGVVASHRASLAQLFEAGWGRNLFEAATAALPRFAVLAGAAGDVAAGSPVHGAEVARLVAGILAFGLAGLALAIWRFERRDY